MDFHIPGCESPSSSSRRSRCDQMSNIGTKQSYVEELVSVRLSVNLVKRFLSVFSYLETHQLQIFVWSLSLVWCVSNNSIDERYQTTDLKLILNKHQMYLDNLSIC